MMTIMSFIVSYFLLLFAPLALSNVYVYDISNKLVKTYTDQTAGFGPSFPSAGLEGYITTTYPESGCKKLSPPPSISSQRYPWIALILRTQGIDACEFAVKVQNAQNANFSAAIIYNYEDEIIKMGSSGKSVRIPSTMITHKSGLALISQYLYNKTTINGTSIYHVKITPEPSTPLIAYLIPICAVIAFSFCAIIVFVLVKIHSQRCNNRRHRLPRSALKQLKIKKFVKGDRWEVCAICLDDYEDGAKLRILPCDHAYHMKCIDPWLTNNRRQCPVCKRYVFPNHNNSDEEGSVADQQSRTPTEQTPLVDTNDDGDPTTDILSNRPLISERRLLSPTGRGAHNVSFASDEFLTNGGNLSSSQQSANQATTTGLIFDRTSTNSRRYGSLHDTSATPRVANFFVGSIGGATDNTNVSSRSIVEDVSDIEVINDDEDEDVVLRSTRTCSRENSAYVTDEDSSTNAHFTKM